MPLSAKQMEYLALAWQCFESEPKINYAKFATVAGLASAASARELMRVTKNKLKDEYGALSSTLQTSNNGNGTSTNTTPQPRTPKRKATATATTTATPASRKRARKAVAAETSDDVDCESENMNAENEDADQEDAVTAPSAVKKARTKARAGTAPVTAAAPAVGGVRVKSEFGREDGIGGEEVLAEEEVSIF